MDAGSVDAGVTDAGAVDGTMPSDAGPQRECADVTSAGLLSCDDFASGRAVGWMPEAGEWAVVEGRYVGVGPESADVTGCGASQMVASLREGSTAEDVSVHVAMTSRERVDKVIVLRASDASNRIEINVRAAPYDDLVVQELVDCEVVRLVPEGEVAVPNAVGQTIDVDAALIGSRLTVAVDGTTVLDRELEFANRGAGLQGLAVITRAEAVFDDVWISER